MCAPARPLNGLTLCSGRAPLYTMMTWDDDALEYGYVVTRLPGGGWWHVHFGRSVIEYDCDLLRRRTNVFACVQHFGAGAVARSPRYLLTLDGEGVETELTLDFSWNNGAADAHGTDAAVHFQAAVMPLLYDSAAMQRAIAELVERGQYLRSVAAGKLLSTGSLPAAAGELGGYAAEGRRCLKHLTKSIAYSNRRGRGARRSRTPG